MGKMDFIKLSSSERYRFRKRAVTLLKSGKKQKEIAALYGVRTATVKLAES
jgi:DNA-binding NarL/FixJ family response regulator